MFRQFWLWLPIGLGVVALAAIVWLIFNHQGYKARGRRRVDRPGSGRDQQRKGDARVLTAQEKRQLKSAQMLLAAGKVLPAATMFEQLNLPREAIKILEDSGHIHEAAKILMRMGRHNRAGVVYARNDMWEHAAQCFKVAGMPLEAANAARQTGNWKMATELYEKGARYDLAGECLERLREFQKAARFYQRAGMRERSMRCYDQLAKTTSNLSLVEFENDELRQIVAFTSEGHTEAGLANILASRNCLPEVILNLIGKGLRTQASELFKRATTDISPMLIADVNYQDDSAENLALMLLDVDSALYAGKVYERMESFEKAADAFEKAEDFERASYCAERSGQGERAAALKAKVSTSRRVRETPAKAASSNFALSDVTDRANLDPDSVSIKPLDIQPVREGVGSERRFAPPPPPPPPPPPSSHSPRSPVAALSGNFSLDADEDEEELAAAARDDEAEGGFAAAADRSFDESADEHTHILGAPAGAIATPPSSPPPHDASPQADEGEASGEDRHQALVLAPSFTLKAPDDSPASSDGGACAAFHKAKFLSELEPEQREKLWDIGKTLSLAKGETLLTYNDEPRGIYIILEGEIAVYRVIAGHDTYIDEMVESACFGELWLLADQPTAVRFVATKDSKIRLIEREPFNELLDKDGTVARKLYKRFTMRLLKRLLKPQTSQKNQAAS